MSDDILSRLTTICARLPEAQESTTVHHPSFKVRGKAFVMLADPNKWSEVESLWIKSTPGEQQALIQSDPEQYFKPPYVGPSGWIGVRLTKECDWDEVAELVTEGWRLAAPKRAIKAFDEAAAED
ncbi:MmcQ/YjbR family DNA-binding protein [Natronoglycomyces albus]|uniref:MmcQ/YjbR family DNA-binding protein n=1 Tax=Natronoglycomyces albus TaxID=2811108 RepID=A0A895XI67_9ACTN|nr:MmcQ/YjbR family DNA-binding protein [Natronoglycomyces albus]QSB05511.1 MmcQ/YjbR family DNA-binding protein [Natronoglycomyces albus]